MRAKVLRLEGREGASQPCRIRESSPGSGTCLWESSEVGEGLACSGNKRTPACARGPLGHRESRGTDTGRDQLCPAIEDHSQEAGHDLKYHGLLLKGSGQGFLKIALASVPAVD